jgi:hypothetical protein
MRFFLFLLFMVSCVNVLTAQTIRQARTGQFSGIFHAPLFSSTDASHVSSQGWDIQFQSLPNEADERLFNVDQLKALNQQLKGQLTEQMEEGSSMNKTTAANPTIGKNFRGQDLKSWTPTDNSIAVSKGGMIVSCINQGLAYYDTSGVIHMIGQSWTAFINDTTLKSAKFDPRVIYDSLHNRFILVVLHGFSSTKSKIIVAFSKTAYPLDGWNIYKRSGNPFADTSWTDYPTIGINDDELFINGNRFGDAPNYDYNGTFIYQIGLAQGYAGTTLNFGLWDNIQTPDSLPGITLYPASDGLGKSLKEKMYFVQLMPDSGSHVYLYKIDGLLSSSTKTLTAFQYPIPHYEVCADAYQKNPVTGFTDSLSTGSAWTQNAFYLNNTVHFTFDASMPDKWCGLHYGRIYLDSNKAVVSAYGKTGTDMCYPAVASLGYDSSDRSVAIAFVQSDSSSVMLPETAVITLDNNMTWSSNLTVKKGDTNVNILYPPDYPIQPERWGDYTGISRNYVNGIPQVWMAGAYGANTPPRNNSYGTWIAQIISGEGQLTGIPQAGDVSDKAVLYPNPASDMFSLEFDNTEDGEVTISLFDISGRLVKVLFEDHLRKSKNRLAFNRLMLPSGSYVVTIQRNKKMVYTEKLVVR